MFERALAFAAGAGLTYYFSKCDFEAGRIEGLKMHDHMIQPYNQREALEAIRKIRGAETVEFGPQVDKDHLALTGDKELSHNCARAYVREGDALQVLYYCLLHKGGNKGPDTSVGMPI